MALTVDRVDGGYLVQLSPPEGNRAWKSVEPVRPDEVFDVLRKYGVDPREALDAIWGADRLFRAGATERQRFFIAVRGRAVAGQASPEDLESVRRELSDSTSPIDHVFLVSILNAAGRTPESELLLQTLIQSGSDTEAIQSALAALGEWESPLFETLALPVIRGAPWDLTGEVQVRTMFEAALLLRRGRVPHLFDELVSIGMSERQTANARRGARTAIAMVAGASPAVQISTERLTMDELEKIIDAARMEVDKHR